MFLYGKNIINDHDHDTLVKHLIFIKAVRGKDYIYHTDKEIILNSTDKIKNSSLIYKHKIIYLSNDLSTCSIIGRSIDRRKRIVYDVIFDRSPSKNDPYTLGWTFDFNYTSVINSIMKIINMIPIIKRNKKKYIVTFICSKIDSCNDPVNGIIEGRWKSTFTQGLRPSDWKNSRHVFRTRIENNNLPVKYGQCWVLADILTGIFLFLGLPARSIKITNAIMDIYDTCGVDTFSTDNTSKIVFKSGCRFNPINMIQYDKLIYKDELIDLSLYNTNINKGSIFDIDNYTEEIDEDDIYDLNHFIEESKNTMWNFHVWTEVFIEELNDWFILDPCPLLNNPKKSNFKPYTADVRPLGIKSAKFFGPISISDIRNNNIPTKLIYNFKYLYSCINGQYRYWNPLYIEEKKETIMYLNDVKSTIPQVYERLSDGILYNMTFRYKSSYNQYHKYHPLFMNIKDNDLSNIYIHINPEKKISKYVIQFSLFCNNTPLYIHREKMNILTIDKLYFMKSDLIKKYRLKANKITICLYNIDKNLFWNQCITI